MTVTVRLPTQLREYAGGNATVAIDGSTVGEVLRALERQHPAVGRRITDEQGQIRRHVHIYIGDERASSPAESVADGAELTIMPAVSGG